MRGMSQLKWGVVPKRDCDAGQARGPQGWGQKMFGKGVVRYVL